MKPIPNTIANIIGRAGATWTSEERQQVLLWVCDSAQLSAVTKPVGKLSGFSLDELKEYWHAFLVPNSKGLSPFDRTADKFDPQKASFPTFLRGKFVYWCKDELRKKLKHAKQHPSLEALTTEDQKFLEKNYVQGSLEEKDLEMIRKAILDCIKALSSKFRIVFWHRYLSPDGEYIAEDETPIKDIATTLEMQETLVRVRLMRARQSLQPCLKAKGAMP